MTGDHASQNSQRNAHFASLPAPAYDFFNRQYEKLEPLVSHRKQTTAPLSNRQIPAILSLELPSASLRLFHFPYPRFPSPARLDQLATSPPVKGFIHRLEPARRPGVAGWLTAPVIRRTAFRRRVVSSNKMSLGESK